MKDTGEHLEAVGIFKSLPEESSEIQVEFISRREEKGKAIFLYEVVMPGKISLEEFNKMIPGLKKGLKEFLREKKATSESAEGKKLCIENTLSQ